MPANSLLLRPPDRRQMFLHHPTFQSCLPALLLHHQQQQQLQHQQKLVLTPRKLVEAHLLRRKRRNIHPKRHGSIRSLPTNAVERIKRSRLPTCTLLDESSTVVRMVKSWKARIRGLEKRWPSRKLSSVPGPTRMKARWKSGRRLLHISSDASRKSPLFGRGLHSMYDVGQHSLVSQSWFHISLLPRFRSPPHACMGLACSRIGMPAFNWRARVTAHSAADSKHVFATQPRDPIPAPAAAQWLHA